MHESTKGQAGRQAGRQADNLNRTSPLGTGDAELAAVDVTFHELSDGTFRIADCGLPTKLGHRITRLTPNTPVRDKRYHRTNVKLWLLTLYGVSSIAFLYLPRFTKFGSWRVPWRVLGVIRGGYGGHPTRGLL